MEIALTGSGGLIGSVLSSALRRDGHRVVSLVRRSPGPDEIEWDPGAGILDATALVPFDAVVHLAGAGIGDRRWNNRYKTVIRDSRVQGTSLIARCLAELDDGHPRRLVSASAIGFYGNRGDEELTETSDRGQGFLAEVCDAWESATAPATDAGVSVVHLRTGIVLTDHGGALAKLLPIFRLGLGGRVGDGHQWMSWISLDDEVRAIQHLLTSSMTGPVNLTAPHPVRNAEFAAELGSALSRPSAIPVPAFAPRLLLGTEMANSLLFDSQRVVSSRLSEDGFDYHHPNLADALGAVIR